MLSIKELRSKIYKSRYSNDIIIEKEYLELIKEYCVYVFSYDSGTVMPDFNMEYADNTPNILFFFGIASTIPNDKNNILDIDNWFKIKERKRKISFISE